MYLGEIRGVLPVGICRGKIGCALTASLLFDKSISETKNELLVCKLSTVIFRGEYRSHYESTAYVHSHGSWDCG